MRKRQNQRMIETNLRSYKYVQAYFAVTTNTEPKADVSYPGEYVILSLTHTNSVAFDRQMRGPKPDGGNRTVTKKRIKEPLRAVMLRCMPDVKNRCVLPTYSRFVRSRRLTGRFIRQ